MSRAHEEWNDDWFVQWHIQTNAGIAPLRGHWTTAMERIVSTMQRTEPQDVDPRRCGKFVLTRSPDERAQYRSERQRGKPETSFGNVACEADTSPDGHGRGREF